MSGDVPQSCFCMGPCAPTGAINTTEPREKWGSLFIRICYYVLWYIGTYLPLPGTNMHDPNSKKSAIPSGPAEPIVIRGGVQIDAPRDDARKSLIALLALGLRLDNVGVFLGAGASCGAGGKTMKDVWSAFSSSDPKTIEWLRGAGLLPKKDDPTILPNIEVALPVGLLIERGGIWRSVVLT
jgi:hypothetical protein